MTVTPAAPQPYARERRLAELAVQRAAVLTNRVSRSLLAPPPPPAQGPNGRRPSAFSKSDASPVTTADFAAQALLISAVHAVFPDDGFVGEEDASSLRQDPQLARDVFDLVSSTRLDDPLSDGLLATPKTVEAMCDMIDLGGRGTGGATGRFWALDPIDGTAAFVKGQQYAIALALIEDGAEVLGVLGCPNLALSSSHHHHRRRVTETEVDDEGLGLMLSAVRGQGAEVRPMGWGALQPAQRVKHQDKQPQRPGAASGGDTRGVVSLGDLHFIDSSTTSASCSRKVRQLAQAVGVAYPGTELYSSHMRYVALILGGPTHVQVRVPKAAAAVSYIWDHAGAQLIYTEAGAGTGKVTDLHGRAVDFGRGRELAGNWGVITADESVHGRILELVAGLLAADRA